MEYQPQSYLPLSAKKNIIIWPCPIDSAFSFDQIFIKLAGNQDRHKILVKFEFGPDWNICFGDTGNSRYVDFAYLDTITYVEVIFHSQHFFSMYLCISTPSMSKTVNMKQRVSRVDFSCPRRNFYYICYFLCRSKKSALTRAPYCLFRLCTCMTWGAKIFKQKSKPIKVIYTFFRLRINPLLSAIKCMAVLIRNHTQYR